MVKFEGNIVQFGFGAVGKSFYEKVRKEIKFNENNYYVITANKNEFDSYISLGGLVNNFITSEIKKENFIEVFSNYLKEGDLLIDFADTVGTRDILNWCAESNIMYINTGEADWPENWYSIFNENKLKNEIKNKHMESKDTNKYPIVLQHGNNPGLVSHFVKAGIRYIVKSQFKKDKILNNLLKENKYNELARNLKIKMIHVNDIDLQEISDEYKEDKLYSTWCIDSFFFETLSEATVNIGTHEEIDYEGDCNFIDKENGYLEFKNIAVDKKMNTYYPNGKFEGFVVPHEETITIAKSLEVVEDDKIVYRPSVLFIYSPCEYAKRYMLSSKVNDYPNVDLTKPLDVENPLGESIIRGHKYPKFYEIPYKEKIKQGTEYVGVLIIGKNFKPVWVGNRIEPSFLYKDKKNSYWQTPTITPVAMSALAAVSWMIKNKEKVKSINGTKDERKTKDKNQGNIYFPDDILDYDYILNIAEKYISKTIYKTFEKEELKENVGINFENIQLKDIMV